ncbi:hypothetical protein B0T14DRAFT_309792 [Immersiella caudata]|uniref:Uncharacterized protein n=1 Tax=Immersiella caudata TaxID=314043 RepID=A0AA40BUV5_9PEZI|nr:hypothetical protein B0T14DRAFT_309792 [Immersiella caudata]
MPGFSRCLPLTKTLHLRSPDLRSQPKAIKMEGHSTPSTSQPNPSEPPPDYELSVFTHPHKILVTVPIPVNSPSEPTSLVRLYIWSQLSVQEIDGLLLTTELLSTIRGLTSLGAFHIPYDCNLTLADKLSAFLLVSSNRELGTETLSSAMMQINNAYPGRKGVTEQFFAFPVFSNRSDHPIGDEALLPVWKWVKPDSPYRKSGFWEKDLHAALEDGGWNGGKELSVLMGAVSEEAFYTIACSEMGLRFSSLERAELVARQGGDL